MKRRKPLRTPLVTKVTAQVKSEVRTPRKLTAESVVASSAPNVYELPGISSWMKLDEEAPKDERTPPTMSQKIVALFDFWTFCDIIYFKGGSDNFSTCHKETWSWHVRPEASLRQLIIESRGMLKSTIFSVGRTLWRLYQNPNIRIFVGCESLKLSHSFIREIKGYLEDTWLQDHVWNARPHFDGPLIPVMDKAGKQRRYEKYGDTTQAEDKKIIWRADAIQVLRPRVMREASVVAGAVNSTATGQHYDEVIFDDVVTFDNSDTEDKLERVFSWIADIESVLDPSRIDGTLYKAFWKCCPEHIDKLAKWCVSGGRNLVIGTLYDEQDYYHYIINNQDVLQYDVHMKNIYVNGKDNSDGYRWPEVWNEEFETLKKAQLTKRFGSKGAIRWYSQYENRIVNPAEIKAEWDNIVWLSGGRYRYLEKENVVRVYDSHFPDAKAIADVRIRICVDPAATESKKSDFTAIVVGGFGTDKTLYVFDFWMEKADSSKWIPQLYKYSSKWNCITAHIECVAFSTELLKVFRLVYFEKYWPLLLMPYSPTNQMSKVDRIENGVYVLMHNSQVAMATYISKHTELKKQVQFLRRKTVKDDGPDVLNQLYEVSTPPSRQTKRGKRKPKYVVGASRYGGYQYA